MLYLLFYLFKSDTFSWLFNEFLWKSLVNNQQKERKKWKLGIVLKSLLHVLASAFFILFFLHGFHQSLLSIHCQCKLLHFASSSCWNIVFCFLLYFFFHWQHLLPLLWDYSPSKTLSRVCLTITTTHNKPNLARVTLCGDGDGGILWVHCKLIAEWKDFVNFFLPETISLDFLLFFQLALACYYRGLKEHNFIIEVLWCGSFPK